MTAPTTTARDADHAGLLAYLEGHDIGRLAADATFTDAASGMTWSGPEAIGGMLDWFYHGVFEARLEDERVLWDADQKAGALEATFVGVHRGEFAGVPATGREVRIPLVVLYDVAEGLVTSGRIHFGVGAFLAQVALPA